MDLNEKCAWRKDEKKNKQKKTKPAMRKDKISPRKYEMTPCEKTPIETFILPSLYVVLFAFSRGLFCLFAFPYLRNMFSFHDLPLINTCHCRADHV